MTKNNMRSGGKLLVDQLIVHGATHVFCVPGESYLAALDAFARTIGLAFQIKDDILDVEGETEVIGKQAGADQRLGKATYPRLFGVEKSRRRCDELLADALLHLRHFGDAGAPLEWLARYIVERGR